MTFSQVLDYFSYLVQLAVNVAVVYCVFPIWRQRELRFFALLGFSALLGIFTSVTSYILGHYQISEYDYYWIWCGTTVLIIVDMILYAVGIVLLVRHFQGAGAAASAPAAAASPDRGA